MSQKDINKAIRWYFNKNMSTAEIAKELGTYPKKIEREIKAAGHKLRSRSEAQKHRLESGKAKHPTKGSQLAQETKEKISESVHQKWTELSERERKARRRDSKLRFERRKDKESFIRNGLEAAREASKTGSATEIYISDLLNNAGFTVLQHQKHMIAKQKMHLDILIPKHKIAIEVDGPAHYDNLWGEDRLAESKKRDREKNGLLINKGYRVIRVKVPSNTTLYTRKTLGEKTLQVVEDIIAGTNLEMINHISMEK